MDTIQSSFHLFQRWIFGELGETKGTRMFPKMLARTKFTLSLGLIYTLVGRSKSQQAVEMEIIKESQEALKWPHLMNECRNLLK
jgi:hypothetical protein